MHILFSLLAVLGAGSVGFLYWLGLAKSFLWYYPWFDIPLHLAGGLTIGLWGCSLTWRRNYTAFQAFVFILLLSFSIGVAWELFEYAMGLSIKGEPGYLLDTLGDIANDVGAALVAWVVYWLLRIRQETRL